MIRSLPSAFDCIKTMIRKYSPYRLFKDGYLNEYELNYFYDRESIFKTFKFEYVKVFTSEGGAQGVYHILFFGSYLPQAFLSSLWMYYTGTAFSVDIRVVKDVARSNSDVKRLSRYCIDQYVVGQKNDDGSSAFVSYSKSFDWSIRNYNGVYWFFKKNLKEGIWDKDLTENNWLTFLYNNFHPPPRYSYLEDYT